MRRGGEERGIDFLSVGLQAPSDCLDHELSDEKPKHGLLDVFIAESVPTSGRLILLLEEVVPVEGYLKERNWIERVRGGVEGSEEKIMYIV